MNNKESGMSSLLGGLKRRVLGNPEPVARSATSGKPKPVVDNARGSAPGMLRRMSRQKML